MNLKTFYQLKSRRSLGNEPAPVPADQPPSISQKATARQI